MKYLRVAIQLMLASMACLRDQFFSFLGQPKRSEYQLRKITKKSQDELGQNAGN